MKTSLHILLLSAILVSLAVKPALSQITPGDPGNFITTWRTDHPGPSNDNQITIPTIPPPSAFTYNYHVYWERVNDASVNGTELNVTGDLTITFPAVGVYRVEITGLFPAIRFGSGGDSQKILTVDQWGDIVWQSMEGAFWGATFMNVTTTAPPDLSNVTSLESMFRLTQVFNQDLSNWNVSNVTTMQSMFRSAEAFNQNLSGWDVSNVTSMSGMFHDAVVFNQDVSGWDVSNVTSMRGMFEGAEVFNQDLSGWDVSNVTDLGEMFRRAAAFNSPLNNWSPGTNTVQGATIRDMFRDAVAFNQDLSSWDVSKVTDMVRVFQSAAAFNSPLNNWSPGTDTGEGINMEAIFRNAVVFNQDLSSWDVSNVTRMAFMFDNAKAFDQDLSSWDVSNVTSMGGMFQDAEAFNQDLSSWVIPGVTNMANIFNNSGLSTANYDATLIGWADQNLNLQNDVDLGASGITYCDGAGARQLLINARNWNITGDNLAAGCQAHAELDGGEGFRMLSAPAEVSLASLLSPIWTQGAFLANFSGGDPNVWTWNTVNNEWMAATDLSANIPAGTGLLAYVFDEDEYGNPASAVWPKTLSLSPGNNLPVSPQINNTSGSFTLLGNPVNTGIFWNNFTRNDVDNAVFIWDPNKGADGDWVFWDGSLGDLTGGIIHPFQGFFVRTSAGASSPSLTIPQSAATIQGDFYGKLVPEEPLAVRLLLHETDLTSEASAQVGLQSTAWLRFSEKGSMASNPGDVLKLQSLAENYAVLALDTSAFTEHESSLLWLKNLPMDLNTQIELPLTTTATRDGTFTIETTGMNLPGGWTLSLRDNQAGAEISLEEGTKYTFELEGNKQYQKTLPYQGGIKGGVSLALSPLQAQKTGSAVSRFTLLIIPGSTADTTLPENYGLGQNYPNPFNPSTVISYELPEQGLVSLMVYDLAGRHVATLVDSHMAAGHHQARFDAGNLSSGIYLYRLAAGGQVITRKLTLIK